MALTRKHNHDYSGGIPLSAGDRYYSQDLGRDFNFLIDKTALVIYDNIRVAKGIAHGWIVTAGTQDCVNVSAGIGYAPFDVTVPAIGWTIPPSTTTETITYMRIESAAIANFNLSTAGATGNGSTVNYLKIKFAWSSADTRQREKKLGTYPYTQTPSYTLTCNATPPTSSEICLMEILWNSASHAITFQNNSTANSRSINMFSIKPTGSNDDQPIQATINQLTLLGYGTCYMAAGNTFDIQNTINMKNSVTLKGEGMNTTILNKNNSALTKVISFASGVNYTNMEDFSINGKKTQIASDCYGIWFQSGYNYTNNHDNTIKNVNVYDVFATLGNFSYSYYNALNLVNCFSSNTLTQAYQTYHTCFKNCNSLTNCYAIGYINNNGNGFQGFVGYDSCNQLTGCYSEGNGNGSSNGTTKGFYNCTNLSSCYSNNWNASGSLISGFESCLNLSACKSSIGTSGQQYGFHTCTGVNNCISSVTGGSTGYPFYNSKKVLLCTASGNAATYFGFKTCYADAGVIVPINNAGAAANDTAACGWNTGTGN